MRQNWLGTKRPAAIRICRFAVAAVWLPQIAAAQYRIESWTADTGLPIGSVNRVLQTQDGHLWMATFAGLVRYNGASFRVFDTGNSKGLRTSRFVNLFEDRQGGLWAPTEGQGLTRYYRGDFVTYTVADGLMDNNTSDLFYDTEGHFLIDSNKGMVEWKDGRFVRSHSSVPSLGDPSILIQGRTASGATWYTDPNGLHRYEHDRVSASVPLHLDMKRVYEDRSGCLWIEYERPGSGRVLASYQNGKLRDYGKADGVPPFATFGVSEDRHGTLWFGLGAGTGLLRFQNGKFTHFTMAEGSAGNHFGTVYEDREGTLWVPSEGGLSWFRPKTVTAYTPANGLAANNVYPILQDRRGAIWIGTWPGLTKFENGVMAPAGKAYGPSKNVTSLFEDREGSLWIGSWGAGIQRMKNGRLESFPTTEPPGSVVRAILQDRAGDMWFGGPSGLTRWHDRRFSPVTAKEGFLADHVFSMFASRGGDLWIGTETGVTRYSAGVFTSYSEANGFPGKFVRAFYEDERGVIWLGTYDTGVYRYQNGRFTRYTKAGGLLDNGAFQILEDKRGNFWMTCNAGIYRVSRKDLEAVAAGQARTVTSVPYGKPDGMPSAECNGGAQPAGIQARDGRLWLPTQKGVAVVDPDTIATNELPPPVVIEEIVVDQHAAPSRSSVEVLPGQGSLEIHYAALTFIRPELTQFKYRLEGLDPDWVEAGNRRAAYYSHLPFGTYTFRVIAANRDRVWNQQGASVVVRIVPPFSQTLPFALLVGAAVLALGTLVLRRRLRRLKREQALQDAFSRQLIDSQEKERKRIAAGLHDSLSQTLSIIKHRAELTLNNGHDPESAREQMEEIAGAAADALAEVREIVHDLRPVEIDRLGLTKAISAMVKKVAGSTQIRLVAEIDPLNGLFSSHAEINVYRMVQEGLSNIVNHSDADEAVIRVRRDPHGIEITMRDNGKGFSPEASVDAAQVAGLGLVSISERARIIGGKLQVQSAPGQGTTLTIRIGPENTAHVR